MAIRPPVAVLIHGHHLQAPEWEKLVWGEAGLSRVGRIPRGIEVAFRENAELIIWGTGASTDPATGQKEAEYTQSFARTRFAELAAYTGATEEEILSLIDTRSLLSLETTTTKDETHEALKACQERGIGTLYLVSSPTHVPRCLLTAIQFEEESKGMVLCGVAAETTVPFWHPKDVAIVEPAHRPDRSEAPMNLLAKRMARVRKYPERAGKIYYEIKGLLDSFDEETEQKNS